MICGTVASVTNNGANLYLTESALKRIMPAATAAVILGTFGAAAGYNSFMNYMVGTAPVNIPVMIAAVIVMILFCFGCAYFGAGRIKKISPTELMTE